ncbi:hypothetical protein [Dictyobacter formicarum]|uniref:hypothetical protein n=1 Tax=Dictyobacter formicarum TaxID=2778368 RepID=UPI001915873E|nr:hypothetical protein [Dictyobacter formicarum]
MATIAFFDSNLHLNSMIAILSNMYLYLKNCMCCRNGNFTFNNVSQGTYDLLWYANDGVTERLEYAVFSSDKSPFETITVGPLCPVTTSAVG